MDLTEQLWTLQQIYQYENSYYDSEKKLRLYRIPSDIPADQLEALKQADRMPGQIFVPEHDEIWDAFYALADSWTLAEAADAFIAGLWSAPPLWQSALAAKVLAPATPHHAFLPYGGSADTCTVCGFHKTAVDAAYLWMRRMTDGVPLDGDPTGYVYALREMAKAKERPVPTAYDLWTFRAVLTVIRNMPSGSRYSKVREALHKEKLLPLSSKGKCQSLLEVLALIGILDTPEHPGMIARFTTYKERDLRPLVRVEAQAPLAWWDSSAGVNEAALEKIFRETDCSSVSLADRPAPIPPLSETVIGRLAQKKKPRKRLPASPDAGKGPAQAGDVYAVRVRDDLWITVYCHQAEEKYVTIEYLDGIFSEMPMKSQLFSAFRLRDGKRWQQRVSGMDRTTGVKRVARNIPMPQTDLAEPDRKAFATANSLAHLARWCFRELP
ncbi:MAG: hypothetical protein NC420_10445 [Eubacterium sp.]|nr:hypothetical protein [Eubacterium sp.]MCM1305304.1 hypothetical protein [Butyrivibrio sp.]MCM1344397.1 hypothetical protein [Muribaculaceae bacterium]MCM1411717.1 hypothetical protein [Lachnospiraceae bacterium]